MGDDHVIIVGAGIGGLTAAISLAARGIRVSVLERGERAGGKMREIEVGGTRIDCGPTVLTMRWVFDELFAAADAALDDYITVRRLETLARHAWSDTEQFDLFADIDRAAEAVGDFSGSAEALRFRAFCAEARTIYQTLKAPFLSASRPNPISLTQRIGFHRPGALLGIKPFSALWDALGVHFKDPRLRQLFGRYATYNGSSPFLAPATLMLIAHVEQDGVWIIEGGMQRLADALEKLARRLGVTFRFGAEVAEVIVQRGRAAGARLADGEHLSADAVIVNADAAALATGLLGYAAASGLKSPAREDRSLSAVTWAMTAKASGFPLLRHNVFFSRNYQAEFEQIFRQSRLPHAPTVYVCAQDRADIAIGPDTERLFMLVNAPPVGDSREFNAEEIEGCLSRTRSHLESCGLSLTPLETMTTTPSDFHRLFPGTGGALYGPAAHGWTAAFRRPGSVTSLPGLYLAGGSVHPGAGVPMAALSGQLAARRLISDRASTWRSRPVAMSGGTSTESATMAARQSR